jgi:hypothetical protein
LAIVFLDLYSSKADSLPSLITVFRSTERHLRVVNSLQMDDNGHDGADKANPLAAILSGALMLEYLAQNQSIGPRCSMRPG